jgi:hypothetical protein
VGVNGGPGYPPEPWDLHGHGLVGVWLLPSGVAPPPPSPRTRALRIFGRTVVAAAWFVYEEPSPLTYGEVMSTLLVRHGARPRVSITHIWVDSPASMAGGRELWGIPKQLAAFEMSDPGGYVGAGYAADGIGRAVVGRSWRLPFRAPVRFTVAQDVAGDLRVSPVRGSARLSVVRARWWFDPDGPLALLSGRTPLLSLTCRPFHLVFGTPPG